MDYIYLVDKFKGVFKKLFLPCIAINLLFRTHNVYSRGKRIIGTTSIHLYTLCRCMVPKFLVPIAVGIIIQVIKVIIDLMVAKRLQWTALRSAGGFPSVHSGIAASITTVMFFEHGVDSTAFALAFCFSFLFWYDAANIRYEAGQHAKFLKKIGEELGGILDIGIKTPLLKERLGHTFIEVMGGVVIGAGLTVLIYWTSSDIRLYFNT